MNLRNFNPRKIRNSDSFWRKTNFPQLPPTTGQKQSDVEFFGESYDAYHVNVAHCTNKFYTKKLEKNEKLMNIQEYSKKFQHFSAQ